MEETTIDPRRNPGDQSGHPLLLAEKERYVALAGALQRAEATLRLSAGVVHDVRNALQIVLGHSELLAGDRLNEHATESVQAIHHAASHAVAILGDLTAMVRASESTATVVDSATLAERLRPLVRQVAGSRVECLFRLEQPVWPVVGETHHLEAVLINLCANARDAMPDGGQLVFSVRNTTVGTPRLAGLTAGDYVAFSVRDTGTGMTPEVLDRATEAFYTTKADRGGSGLGLARAQEFARRSGGTLRIDSTVGRGTTVQLLLPRAAPATAPDADFLHRRDGVLQTLRHQVRTPCLRDALGAWQRACGAEALPRPFDIDVAVAPHADQSLVVLIDPDAAPGRFRLQRVGPALQDALDAAIRGQADVASSLVGALGDVYRRVAESRVPSYERVHYMFGDGPAADFERLVLPAGADGRRVSHLIGIVAFSGPGGR